jgi:hypothetical protein
LVVIAFLVMLVAWLLHVQQQAILNQALIRAVYGNDVRDVARLLARGADPDAVEHEHLGLIDSLKEAIQPRSEDYPLHALDIAVSTETNPPLGPEEQRGNPWYRDNARIVALLLEHGASAHGAHDHLESLVEESLARPLVLEEELRHGARADASAMAAGQGNSILSEALTAWDMPARDIEALINAGADVNTAPLGGDTYGAPLLYAIQTHRKDVEQVLRKHGAAVQPGHDVELKTAVALMKGMRENARRPVFRPLPLQRATLTRARPGGISSGPSGH